MGLLRDQRDSLKSRRNGVTRKFNASPVESEQSGVEITIIRCVCSFLQNKKTAKQDLFLLFQKPVIGTEDVRLLRDQRDSLKSRRNGVTRKFNASPVESEQSGVEITIIRCVCSFLQNKKTAKQDLFLLFQKPVIGTEDVRLLRDQRGSLKSRRNGVTRKFNASPVESEQSGVEITTRCVHSYYISYKR
ncbi:hypothetical protein SAMN05880580_10996 [Priestia flexa]|nr:hypothetical protein SAMN05880580_10996 [Priestia flexa]